MKALALVALVLCAPAYAQDDAPVVTPVEPSPSLSLTPEERANIAKVILGQDARIKSLEKDAGKVPVLPLVLVGVLSLAAGFGIGFGVAAATQPKP